MRKDKRWKNTINCPIEVTNTEPKIIKIFVDLLRKDYNISNIRLRGQVQIHDGDNHAEIEEYLSKISGIPISQFKMTIMRKKMEKSRKE